MSLVLFNGFETPRINFTPGVSTSYEVGRTGMCIEMAVGSGLGNEVSMSLNNLTAFVMGFAWRRMPPSGGGGDHTIIEFHDSTDYSWGIRHNSSTGIVSISRSQGLSTVLSLGAAAIPIANNLYTYIEIEYYADTNGLDGFIELRFDGNIVFRYDGDTTRWSRSMSSCTWDGSASSAAQLDDFYLLDKTDATATQGRTYNTYLGPVRIEALRPTGNGVSSQWLGSDANSVDNYLLVDDPDQPLTADYVEAEDDGVRDLYEFADPSFQGVVLALDILSHCQAPEGGAPKIKTVVRDPGGTVAVGPGTVPAVEWATRTDTIHALDPLGELWTTGKVAAAQFGVEMGVPTV